VACAAGKMILDKGLERNIRKAAALAESFSMPPVAERGYDPRISYGDILHHHCQSSEDWRSTSSNRTGNFENMNLFRAVTPSPPITPIKQLKDSQNFCQLPVVGCLLVRKVK
jgi:hypothetical protein